MGLSVFSLFSFATDVTDDDPLKALFTLPEYSSIQNARAPYSRPGADIVIPRGTTYMVDENYDWWTKKWNGIKEKSGLLYNVRVTTPIYKNPLEMKSNNIVAFLEYDTKVVAISHSRKFKSSGKRMLLVTWGQNKFGWMEEPHRDNQYFLIIPQKPNWSHKVAAGALYQLPGRPVRMISRFLYEDRIASEMTTYLRSNSRAYANTNPVYTGHNAVAVLDAEEEERVVVRFTWEGHEPFLAYIDRSYVGFTDTMKREVGMRDFLLGRGIMFYFGMIAIMLVIPPCRKILSNMALIFTDDEQAIAPILCGISFVFFCIAFLWLYFLRYDFDSVAIQDYMGFPYKLFILSIPFILCMPVLAYMGYVFFGVKRVRVKARETMKDNPTDDVDYSRIYDDIKKTSVADRKTNDETYSARYKYKAFAEEFRAKKEAYDTFVEATLARERAKDAKNTDDK